jgi:hypothetical protein
MKAKVPPGNATSPSNPIDVAALSSAERESFLRASGINPFDVTSTFLLHASDRIWSGSSRSGKRSKGPSRIAAASSSKVAAAVRTVLPARKNSADVMRAWTRSTVPKDVLLNAVARGEDLVLQVHAIFDALDDQVRRTPGRIALDAFWPCLELIELVAMVALAHGAGDTFVARFVDLLHLADQPAVRCALTWGVNEFLERGEASQCAAKDISLLLLRDKQQMPHAILRQLARLRPELKPLVDDSPHRPSFHLRQLELSLRDHTHRTMDVVTRLLTTSASKAVLIQALAASAPFRLLGISDPLLQMLAVTSVKAVVRAADKMLPPKDERRDVFCAAAYRVLIGFAEAPRPSAFVAIEAIEGLRSHFATKTAKLMAKSFKTGSPFLRQALLICAIEGYEEDFAGTPKKRVPVFDLHRSRFVPGDPSHLDAFGHGVARHLANHDNSQVHAIYWNNRISAQAAAA